MGNNIRLSRLGRVSEEILITTLKVGVVSADTLLSASIDSFVGKGLDDPDPPSTQVKRAINKLVERGLLQDNQGTIQITRRGNWELARRRLLDAPEYHTAKNWDGKWRVVIFDIPELNRLQRDKLRRSFHRYGFYLLQQSVWVYPYRCDEFIRSLKDDLGFQAEVLYMLVDMIENQSKLKEEFNLR